MSKKNVDRLSLADVSVWPAAVPFARGRTRSFTLVKNWSKVSAT